MTDYNIEFAHIYADEVFGEEQSKSAQILKKIIDRVKKQKKSFVVSILIDELHPDRITLNEKNFLEAVKKKDVLVDFIGYESKLIETAENLIQLIPSSELKFEHFHDPEREVLMLEESNKKIGLEEEPAKRPTCALLSASWTLCRLGKYAIPQKAIKSLTGKKFEAEKTITILPEKYRNVENKVLEIIKTTKFKKDIKNIEYVFF